MLAKREQQLALLDRLIRDPDSDTDIVAKQWLPIARQGGCPHEGQSARGLELPMPRLSLARIAPHRA